MTTTTATNFEAITELATLWVQAGAMSLDKVRRLRRLCKIERIDIDDLLDDIRLAQ